MTPKRDILDLLRVVGVHVAGAIAFGLAIAVVVQPAIPFVTASLGYAVGFGSLMVALPLGENLDLERRRGKKRWDMIAILIGAVALLVSTGYLVGLRTSPIIGQSENHLMFPGFALVGLVAGALSSRKRFRRK